MSSEEDSSNGSSYTESETDTGSSMTTTETETDTISDNTETDSETGSDSESDSTDYTDDSDEKASQRAAKKGGVSNDPFKRRVPQSFYDNERRRFGPLDGEWEVAYHNKKAYYVNHKTKQTTWIDPRSIDTRVSDPQKCQMGQLPYGWDEEIDSEIGVYYIDHTTQSTYLDPPWDPRVKFQVAQLKKFIQQQVQLAQMQLADGRLNEDFSESKKELMDEIERLKQKSKELSEEDDSDSDISDLSEDSEPPKTLEEFQERLQTLMQLATTLQSSGQNEVEDAKRANAELERVQKMLEEEEKIRRKLQEDLEELKRSINQPNGGDDEDGYDREESPARSEDSATLNPGEPDFKIKKKPTLSRRTRLEMETEILVLKKRVHEEKTKQKKLEELKQLSENPVPDREGSRPTWIKQLEDVASSSKTLRVKIAMKQQQGPDQLSFRERMLFFAAGAAGGKK